MKRKMLPVLLCVLLAVLVWEAGGAAQITEALFLPAADAADSPASPSDYMPVPVPTRVPIPTHTPIAFPKPKVDISVNEDSMIEVTAHLGECIYVVNFGDTLSGIAAMFGVSEAQICQWNDIERWDMIYPGTPLHIVIQLRNTDK